MPSISNAHVQCATSRQLPIKLHTSGRASTVSTKSIYHQRRDHLKIFNHRSREEIAKDSFIASMIVTFQQKGKSGELAKLVALHAWKYIPTKDFAKYVEELDGVCNAIIEDAKAHASKQEEQQWREANR